MRTVLEHRDRHHTVGPGAGRVPSGLTATTAAGGRSINLSWTDNSGDETGFEIERDDGSGAGFTQIATPEIFRDVNGGGLGTTPHASVTTDVTVYQDTGLTTGSTYTYQVRACNGGGCSTVATSNAVTAL